MDDYITWVWQQPDWLEFHWQDAVILPKLRSVCLKQGMLLGKAGAISSELNLDAAIDQ